MAVPSYEMSDGSTAFTLGRMKTLQYFIRQASRFRVSLMNASRAMAGFAEATYDIYHACASRIFSTLALLRSGIDYSAAELELACSNMKSNWSRIVIRHAYAMLTKSIHASIYCIMASRSRLRSRRDTTSCASASHSPNGRHNNSPRAMIAYRHRVLAVSVHDYFQSWHDGVAAE